MRENLSLNYSWGVYVVRYESQCQYDYVHLKLDTAVHWKVLHLRAVLS